MRQIIKVCDRGMARMTRALWGLSWYGNLPLSCLSPELRPPQAPHLVLCLRLELQRSSGHRCSSGLLRDP